MPVPQPSILPVPVAAIPATPVTEEPQQPQKRRVIDLPDIDPRHDDPIIPAARPEGHFPRNIAHRERVEYSYDPETDEYSATVVEASDPVVVKWDESSPQREARAVGTWDVMPLDNDVTFTRTGRVTIPDSVKTELKRAAQRKGEAVSTVQTLRYDHDIDTRGTETKATGRRARTTAETAISRLDSNNKWAGIKDAVIGKVAKQRASKKKQQRRSRSRDREMRGPTAIPEITIVQESFGRRVGGL